MKPIAPDGRKETTQFGKLTLDPEHIECCPRCGDIMSPPFRALSRVYKKTYICPDCGGQEAANGENRWVPIVFRWNIARENFEDEIHELNEQIEALQKDNGHLTRENINLTTARTKAFEAIRGLEEQIEHQDEQLRDLLANVLNTKGNE